MEPIRNRERQQGSAEEVADKREPRGDADDDADFALFGRLPVGVVGGGGGSGKEEERTDGQVERRRDSAAEEKGQAEIVGRSSVRPVRPPVRQPAPARHHVRRRVSLLLLHHHAQAQRRSPAHLFLSLSLSLFLSVRPRVLAERHAAAPPLLLLLVASVRLMSCDSQGRKKEKEEDYAN